MWPTDDREEKAGETGYGLYVNFKDQADRN